MYVRYWLQLADLGQISATDPNVNTSDPDPNGPYSPIHNVFVNESLYDNFVDYLNSIVINLQWNTSTFTPLQPRNITFLQSYACQQRQLKSRVNLLISVLVADYAFIVGGYSLVVWIAGALQKRQKYGKYFCRRR